MKLSEKKVFKKEYLGGLDFLRTVAICLVFLFHYQGGNFYDWMYYIKDFGWTGVDLFFVLSGYLIANQLFTEAKNKNDIAINRVYIKRSFRILPAYFFVLALYIFIPTFRDHPVISPVWKSITFTQNIGLNPSIYNAFTHAWSLCIEEQFYLFFPIIILFLVLWKAQKKVFYIILVLFLFTFFFRYYLWINYLDPLKEGAKLQGNFWVTWIYYFTLSRLDGLLTGITIAAVLIYLPLLKTKILKYGNLIFVLGCIVLFCGYFLCLQRQSFNGSVYGFLVVSIGYGCWVTAALCPNCFLYKINFVGFKTVAILSYAIYLCHKAICHICHVFFSTYGVNEEGNLMLLICIGATILAAVIIRYIVEKPFLKFRDIILEKQN